MAEILKGAAAVLWPILAIILLIVLVTVFRPAIAAIIESAKSRKFTLKIGGQELTMEEANEQQRNMITDLQAQVLELKESIQSTQTRTKPLQTEYLVQGIPTILWVDDNPKNNSYFVQQLSDLGFVVDLALSTDDGLKRFHKGQYKLIISDMGREEEGSFKITAGLDLLKEIRTINSDVPFIIFSTSANARKYTSKAISAGATSITSSPTELFGILLKEFTKRK